jgi:hypothetical protein
MTALHHVHHITVCCQGIQTWAYAKYSATFRLVDFVIALCKQMASRMKICSNKHIS